MASNNQNRIVKGKVIDVQPFTRKQYVAIIDTIEGIYRIDIPKELKDILFKSMPVLFSGKDLPSRTSTETRGYLEARRGGGLFGTGTNLQIDESYFTRTHPATFFKSDEKYIESLVRDFRIPLKCDETMIPEGLESRVYAEECLASFVPKIDHERKLIVPTNIEEYVHQNYGTLVSVFDSGNTGYLNATDFQGIRIELKKEDLAFRGVLIPGQKYQYGLNMEDERAVYALLDKSNPINERIFVLPGEDHTLRYITLGNVGAAVLNHYGGMKLNGDCFYQAQINPADGQIISAEKLDSIPLDIDIGIVLHWNSIQNEGHIKYIRSGSTHFSESQISLPIPKEGLSENFAVVKHIPSNQKIAVYILDFKLPR